MICLPWSKPNNRQCVHSSTLEVCWHESQNSDEEGRTISGYRALISRNRVDDGREEGSPEAGQGVGARGEGASTGEALGSLRSPGASPPCLAGRSRGISALPVLLGLASGITIFSQVPRESLYPV